MSISSQATNGRRTGASPGQSTRKRLLDAAERLFADKGFAETSVRELTTEADCNLASVNYHFGSKENLYTEVFHRLIEEMLAHRMESIRAPMAKRKPNLEALLLSFCYSFIDPMVNDPERGRRLMRLYSREMGQPLLPSDMFHSQLILPVSIRLREAFDKVCPGLSPKQAVLCMFSLVGQLMHLLQMGRLYSEIDTTDEFDFRLEPVVDHIVAFTAAGMRAAAEGAKR